MADKRITDLPPSAAPSEGDVYPMVQQATTFKQTLTKLRTAVLSAWQPFIRTFLGAADAPTARAAIGAIGSSENITGSAAKLTTARTIASTGDGTWSVSFDGSANATGAMTLASVGTAGTYGSVTTDAKGRVTAGSVSTPIANGGTGGASKLTAGANLGVSAVGTNTTELAQSAMVQAEIANKRPWTNFSTVLTATTGTYTAASATMKYMVAFGICYFQAVITVTTKGTGAVPIITLPFTALAPALSMPIPAVENLVNGKSGVMRLNSAGTAGSVIAYDNTDLITANGCVVYINGSYPIA